MSHPDDPSLVPAGAPAAARQDVPHPVVWTVLYLPFGALSGFVGVPLTFLATQNGLSITEGALLTGANLLTSWLKWSWAPAVDVTFTPKKWYLFATTCTAIGVFAMSALPMRPENLKILLVIIALSSLLNSIVGMAIESILTQCTRPEEQGRVSAWFQVGNLGGSGLGGGLGLTMFTYLPAPWMTGAAMGVLLMACGLALRFVPDLAPHAGDPWKAVKGVLGDVAQLGRTKGGLLSAILCFLPLGTGAAQAVLTQSAVAAVWGADADVVAWVQGYTSAGVTAAGCFLGGWLCDRLQPRVAYALIGGALAAIAVGMAATPHTVTTYVVWNLVYAMFVGLAYAAFSAVVLNAIGSKSGATKYNLYASLSNFPIWWLGLLLGSLADTSGAEAMLYAEAGFAVLAILVFLAATALVARTSLPDRDEADGPAATAATTAAAAGKNL